VPLLDSHLSFELGRPAKIFVDTHIEAGTDWPNELAGSLARSRVLVPLFSKMYFSSEWCIHELFATRFKEDIEGFRTTKQPKGIVVPARIHDGAENDLPDHLKDISRIHAVDLTPFAYTSMHIGGQLFLDFEREVKRWVQASVAPAILRAPRLNAQWLDAITNSAFDCPAPAIFDVSDFPSLA
jgi:hypothetical protein